MNINSLLLFLLLIVCSFKLVGQEDLFNLEEIPNRYNMRYEVELIPQNTDVSCWAAAAAMVVGWRDEIILNPEEIANGVGYWATYHNDTYRIDQLLPPDDLNMFEVWNLVPVTKDSITLQDISNFLWEYGPLWVASSTQLYGNSRLGHVRVVTGMSGDGTKTGTLIYLADPWERGVRRITASNTGSRYTETFEEFIGKLRRLQQQEANSSNPNLRIDAIYIAYP